MNVVISNSRRRGRRADCASRPLVLFCQIALGIAGFCLPLSGFSRAEISPCDIHPDRELIVRDIAVVDWSEAQAGSGGRLALETLLKGMSPDGTAKTALLSWLRAWDEDWPAGPSAFPPGETLIRQWKYRDTSNNAISDADWQPNFCHAPFRLLAIVNRIDRWSFDAAKGAVRNPAEARFVFCFIGGHGASAPPINATVIFEYEIAAANLSELYQWGKAWHDLGAMPQFNDDFCNALADLTTRFTRRGAAPQRPNGSALLQIRTNEQPWNNSGAWILREFHLNCSGEFVSTTLAQTPRDELRSATSLVEYVNKDAPAILDQTYVVPSDMLAVRTQVSDADQIVWTLPGVSDPRVRNSFALNTCNGCHGGEAHYKDSVNFVHINMREFGKPAALSGFLTGATTLNIPAEIPRRQAVMAAILNTEPTSDHQQLLLRKPNQDSLLRLLSQELGRAH